MMNGSIMRLMAEDHLYKVSYRVGGTEREGYEVTRAVRTSIANVDDLVRQLGSKWAGRPIIKVEIVEPVEIV